MTLHSAKGLEFDTVFLPGWEEGLFPSQRTLDENGRAGLEEERRLAYVGITRARKRAYIRFASNRRMHGLWQTAIPSRFLDELPEAHVDVVEDTVELWRLRHELLRREPLRPPRPVPEHLRDARLAARAEEPRRRRRVDHGRLRQFLRAAASRPAADRGRTGGEERHSAARPTTPSASASSTRNSATAASTAIDGNKLTIDFDKAGQKRVLDSFLERH